MNQKLKISIITICKNSASTISKCIQSVVQQSYPNIEYLIIDGASNDDTLQIVDNFKDKISTLISEPDKGIYDAMNKGILAATGDYILFLNADDYLISDEIIKTWVELFDSENYNADIIYGKVFIFNNATGDGNVWKAAKISKYSIFRGSIPHPATLYSKDAFNKCGLFNTSYQVAGDYEWIVRAYLKFNMKFLRQNIIVSVFNKGGISTNKKYDTIIKNEKNRIRYSYYNLVERLYYNFRWFLRKNLF